MSSSQEGNLQRPQTVMEFVLHSPQTIEEFMEFADYVLATSTPYTVPCKHPKLSCCNLVGDCHKTPKFVCKRCHMNSYCSPECQKQFWFVHKPTCQPRSYSKVPTHAVVSYNPQDENYFKNTKDSDQGNRPNISLHIEQGCSTARNFIMRCLHTELMILKARIDLFGAAHLAKILVLVPEKEYADNMLEGMQKHILSNITNPNFGDFQKDWCRHVHADTTPEERRDILTEWSKVDSKHRIVIVSILSELELIVPDVANLIVLSREGPAQMGPRWQRMARMEHQKGCYTQIIFEEEDSEGNDDDCRLWGAQDPVGGCYRKAALEVLTSGGSLQ